MTGSCLAKFVEIHLPPCVAKSFLRFDFTTNSDSVILFLDELLVLHDMFALVSLRNWPTLTSLTSCVRNNDPPNPAAQNARPKNQRDYGL